MSADLYISSTDKIHRSATCAGDNAVEIDRAALTPDTDADICSMCVTPGGAEDLRDLLNGTVTPPADNLNICRDHLIPLTADSGNRRCPACHLDEVTVEPEREVPGSATSREVRNRLSAEDVEDLYPLMREYVYDDDTPGKELALVPFKFGGTMPAGYSEAQERWLVAIVYKWGIREKAITKSSNANETAQTLREEGYGDE